MKPELGSTWGRDVRIRERAVSSVRGVGGRETISGVGDVEVKVEDDVEVDVDECGSGIVADCRECHRR